jgi:hypothetical protein
VTQCARGAFGTVPDNVFAAQHEARPSLTLSLPLECPYSAAGTFALA